MPEKERQSSDSERRLQDLLLYPREDLDIEIKNWLDITQNEDKANLAKAILAIANHGGGYIIIGFEEVGGHWIPAEPRPAKLSLYSQDAVNGIVTRFAEPSFHCEVHQVKNPISEDLFPIILVPGGHSVPIRAKKHGSNEKHVRQNEYYIRRPGPVSEPPQTGKEWDDFIGRCVRINRENLLASIRDILLGPIPEDSIPNQESHTDVSEIDERIRHSRNRLDELVSKKETVDNPSSYIHGLWTVAYMIEGNISQQSLGKLKDILSMVSGHETGWPPWWVPTREGIAPYAQDGFIECWHVEERFRDPGHADFWHALPEGFMFLLRGYQEDDDPAVHKPGTKFDITLPVWRIGECLLHAERLTSRLSDAPCSINFKVTWEGLQGRQLVAWASSNRYHLERRISRQNTISSEIVIQSDKIGDELPEFVKLLTKPLYELFDFFEPNKQLYREELNKMRGGKYY